MSERAPVETRPVTRAFDASRAVILSPLFIVFVSACCMVSKEVRSFAQAEPWYPFVGWNLFLAWIPLVLAYALSWAERRRITRLAVPPLALLWILFLPNAPYCVTDLVHLREEVSAYNVVTLSLLALSGLLIGVKSLQLVHATVERMLGIAAGWRAVQATALLTAVGVYVGRVLRWNSWTVIHHPDELVRAVVRSPSDPGRLGVAFLGTIAFAMLFYLAYRVLAGRQTALPVLARDDPAS